MANYFYHRAGDTRSYTTVNQQPNDAADSARLYGELLDKARKELVSELSYSAPDNRLQYSIINRRIASLYGEEYVVSFKLNGEPITVTIEKPPLEENNFQVIHKALSEAIAAYLITESLKQNGPFNHTRY